MIAPRSPNRPGPERQRRTVIAFPSHLAGQLASNAQRWFDPLQTSAPPVAKTLSCGPAVLWTVCGGWMNRKMQAPGLFRAPTAIPEPPSPAVPSMHRGLQHWLQQAERGAMPRAWRLRRVGAAPTAPATDSTAAAAARRCVMSGRKRGAPSQSFIQGPSLSLSPANELHTPCCEKKRGRPALCSAALIRELDRFRSF